LAEELIDQEGITHAKSPRKNRVPDIVRAITPMKIKREKNTSGRKDENNNRETQRN
jgi:uncharacterized spore protein YtfJ